MVLADSPLAYWRCEDAFGSASLADSSGNGRTMTLNGTRSLEAYSRNSRLGKAVSFISGTGYGSVAAAAWHQITGDMTVECWFKIIASPANGTGYTILCCSAAGATSASNRLYQCQIQVVGNVQGLGNYHESGTGSGITNTQTNWSWNLGQWYHYVCVRDTAALTYARYIDGVLIGTVSYSANPTGGGSSNLNLNRIDDSGGQIGVWSMDEVAIYNTKLSAARIFEHYRAGRRARPTAWDRTVLLVPFNGADTATAAPDTSSFGRTLTWNGNAQLDTAEKKFGTASLLLDGTGDYITLPNSSDLSVATGDFTIEAWVRTTNAAKSQTITNKRDASGAEEHSFGVGASNDLFFSLFNSSAVLSLTGPTLAINTWYHVAASRVGSVGYLHLDGVLVDSDTQSGAPATNTGVFHIGRDGFNTGRDWQGWIDCVRMTKGEARYGAAGFTPPTEAFNPYE